MKPRYRWDWRCNWAWRRTEETFEFWMPPGRLVIARKS
jgi:hypothetical protein